MKKIPLFQPNITRKELKAVENVLKSKQLSRGPCVEIFAKNLLCFPMFTDMSMKQVRFIV